MSGKQSDYFSKQENGALLDQEPVRFTYSFNNIEKTITGLVRERENLIFLYEYRGKYIGTEFFISFSKESVSYKLIKVDKVDYATSDTGTETESV